MLISGFRRIQSYKSNDSSMNLIDFKEKFDAKTVMRNTLRKKL